MRFQIRLLLYLLLPAILFSGCGRPAGSTPVAYSTPVMDVQPTQDVGEEPPTFDLVDDSISTPAYLIPTPDPGATATVAPVALPVAYPTPGDQPISWAVLIDQNLIESIQWDTYRGTFQGSDKSRLWSYSFHYPSDFYASNQGGLNQGYVQNHPPSQGQSVKGAFIKFEVVTLREPPMIGDGGAINPQDFQTVIIAGQLGVVQVDTRLPDQNRLVSAVFSYAGGWVAAAGYINLSLVDPASLEKWTQVMFQILSTFDIQLLES